MKKMLWGRLSVAILSISFVVSACSKASDGKDGAPGATGPAGTANVISSAWQDVAFAINSNQTAYVGVMTAPKIVDSIVNKGDVKVYINVNTTTSPAASPLPYSVNFFSTDTTSLVYTVYPIIQTGKVSLYANADFSTFTDNGAKYFQYRYIIIPSGANARSAIDWNNYAQVKEYLHLKD